MIAFIIYQPFYFILLLLVGVLLLLFFRASLKRKKALRILFPQREEFVFKQMNLLRKWKLFFMLTALVLTIIALARPAWDLKKDKSVRQGKDIIFLLDVSRSMLAEDMFPNRLEACKEAIIDFCEELHGDRISIVVFAGASQIACPLTHDYNFFKTVVQDIDFQSANVGGTYISTGLERVTNDLLKTQKQAQTDIILLSDGGNMGKMEKLGDFLQNKNVNLISIGVGKPNVKSLIPQINSDGIRSKTFVSHKGNPVQTSLQPEALKEVANIANGVYVEADPNTFDLWSIYSNHQQNGELKEFNDSEISSFKEQFQWFIAFAVFLVFITLFIPRNLRNKTFTILILIGLFTSCKFSKNQKSTLKTPELNQLVQSAIEKYNNNDYSLARDEFYKAFENTEKHDAKAFLAYNIANCLYQESFHIEVDEEEDIDIDDFTLNIFTESERFYRIAIDLKSNLKDAFYNYEIVHKAKTELLEKIKKANELQQEINNPVKEIIELLETDLEIQKQINHTHYTLIQDKKRKRFKEKKNTETEQKAKALKLSTTQKQLKDTTNIILQKIWNLEHSTDSLYRALGMNTTNDTIYQIPINKIDSVSELQETVSDMIKQNFNNLQIDSNQKLCTKLLQETIDYFNKKHNQDPNMPEGQQQQQDEDGESEESSEQSESEFSESQNVKQQQLSSTNETEGFPPPNDNAQDILNQERQNNQNRKKKKSKYKSVEKDW